MIKKSPWKMLVNIMPEAICSLIMAGIAFVLLSISDVLILSLVWVVLCIGVYFSALYVLFPKDRDELNSLWQIALKTIKRK